MMFCTTNSHVFQVIEMNLKVCQKCLGVKNLCCFVEADVCPKETNEKTVFLEIYEREMTRFCNGVFVVRDSVPVLILSHRIATWQLFDQIRLVDHQCPYYAEHLVHDCNLVKM